MKTFAQKIKPSFWNHPEKDGGLFGHMFNFRRIWKLTVGLTAGVTLVPLIIITMIDYNVTQQAMESDVLLRTARTASNTKRRIAFFMEERRSALDFLVHDNAFESLSSKVHLAQVLDHLKKGFGGGFEDIGVIDSNGRQQTYVGPYNLGGKVYSDQPWFRKAVENGIYISDAFLGYRHVAHFVIAVKYTRPDGSFYILRTSLNTDRFNMQLADLELSGRGEAFLINRKGILQTPTRFFGDIFEKISLPVPVYSERTEVFKTGHEKNGDLIIGYAYIPDTPFILMIVKLKGELMKPWYEARSRLIGFLLISITVILLVILGVATYLVNNLYLADQKRLMSLHELEYENKMASIGRLAAGIAHEINNPLAIINEKAGLVKDLFTFRKEYADDERLMGVVNIIISSVERCAVITKRLLGFARHPEVHIQDVQIGELVREILSFTRKEAEYRSINIQVWVSDDLPEVRTDRGKMQQIFLNLVNNALSAMETGGKLQIDAAPYGDDSFLMSVEDDGCGIPGEDLERVFEPFFSTKTKTGGTGLGLSITYNLIHEIGGRIEVSSEEGEGTRFDCYFPVKMENGG